MSTRTVVLILVITSSGLAKRSGGFSSRGAARSSHSYPSSSGYSGTGSGGAHTYPHSTGSSGNQYAPKSPATTSQKHAPTHYHSTSEVHHHYYYSPPQYITYGSVNHPVYHSNPPVYVYEYRNSGSRYDDLLTGLALYNLGRMSASHNHYDRHREYISRPGEICKLGISKRNGEYGEAGISCNLMSSFLWEAEENRNVVPQTNTKVVTTINTSETVNNSNNTILKTVSMQNTTVVDALEMKGPSVEVFPGMKCFVIRISHYDFALKKDVDCGLLQAYARNSLHNGSGHRAPEVIFYFVILIIQIYIKV